MSTYHVCIEAVEDETPEMFLCRVGGRSVWVPKAELSAPAGIAVGECDVQADIDYAVALGCGLAEPILPAVSYCRSCQARIRWCKTVAQKNIPVDAEPVEYGGNIVMRGGVATVLKKNEPAGALEKRYQSHFVSCKDAAQHRRK